MTPDRVANGYGVSPALVTPQVAVVAVVVVPCPESDVRLVFRLCIDGGMRAGTAIGIRGLFPRTMVSTNSRYSEHPLRHLLPYPKYMEDLVSETFCLLNGLSTILMLVYQVVRNNIN